MTAGGGAITIVVTGGQRVKSITLQPEVVNPNDVEMLQDLLVAAVNEAIERSAAHAAQKLQGLTGGLGIPGLSSILALPTLAGKFRHRDAGFTDLIP